MVGVSASVDLPLHHKVQKFSSGTGSPGWSWKKGRETVVCVLMNSTTYTVTSHKTSVSTLHSYCTDTIEENSSVFSLIKSTRCHHQGHVGRKFCSKKIRPRVNWGCWLTHCQTDVYNSHKMSVTFPMNRRQCEMYSDHKHVSVCLWPHAHTTAWTWM